MSERPIFAVVSGIWACRSCSPHDLPECRCEPREPEEDHCVLQATGDGPQQGPRPIGHCAFDLNQIGTGYESISQASSGVGIAKNSGSSVLISVRVAMMPRHREALRVCASPRHLPSTYFDSMATPPNPAPTKSISFLVFVLWCKTRSKSRNPPGLSLQQGALRP